MKQDNTIKVFFALVRAGLWEQDVQLAPYKEIDFNQIHRLAEEQSVVGLVAAGLEHVVDTKVPQDILLQFVGQTLQIEQRNRLMNVFIEDTISGLRKADIYTLVLKGQAVAQCYERPLWRSSGDVDFLLSESNFIKAREYFRPLVENGFDPDNENARNINATVGLWVIELHTNQYSRLSSKVDKVIDEVQNSVFYGGGVRSWMNGKTQVFLPSADCDIIFVFTHFIKHFYKGGLGIRQICDWCRLLWTYRNKLDLQLLEKRLSKMGLMSIWKAFASFAVDYLGMSEDAMPFYSTDKKWSHKADNICAFILEVGNFGHNRDTSYYMKYSRPRRKMISMWRRLCDLFRHSLIFPMETLLFIPGTLFYGIKAFIKGA